MNKKLLIRDVTLRDGQQSIFATRMKQDQIDRVLELYLHTGFYATEVWGGAVPDSVMRYLGENPWTRLDIIKKKLGDTTYLTALSRGRNLFGYNPYPDEVIEGFCRHSVESGIGIMRIFDALNDVDNVKATVRFVKQYGGKADCAVCYTVDPKYSTRDKLRTLWQEHHLPPKVFTDDYFLTKAKQMESLGADMITIKDMAGLIPPARTANLMRMLKKEVKVPIDFHTHCTPGYGLASALQAVINGVDILDTAILAFAGGPAAPALELILIFCDKLGVETDVNREIIASIDAELREIRKELDFVDSIKICPRVFDLTRDKLPSHIDKLFDQAIEFAKADKEEELLAATQKIEEWFGFPAPDEKVREAEMPGGMYTNMLAQLKQLKLEKLLPRTLELIPSVRLAAGLPPLVTPTSQIVGAQAVNCAIDEEKGNPIFTTKSIQFVNLVKGVYGHTPIPVDSRFRYKIAGVEDETPYDTRYYKRQDNPVFEEYGGLRLADNERDELLLELFPNVANDFLKKKIEERYMTEIHVIEEEKRRKIQAEKDAYLNLSPEEKEERLLRGLYNYQWISASDEELGRS